MSRYTSLELSKQLHEAFPEWRDTEHTYCWAEAHGTYEVDNGNYERGFPAYDTDYLLDRLPRIIDGSNSRGWLTLDPADTTHSWTARYEPNHTEHIDNYPITTADTPAEALGLLALELKKKEVI